MSVQAVPVEASARPLVHDARSLARLVLAGSLVFFALGVLGRQTVVDGRTLTLVWPAAGVSTLMLGLTPRRAWPVTCAALAVATYLLNTLTGTGAALAVVFVLSNLAQALAGALVLGALGPRLLGGGGTERLVRMRDFWSVAGAAVAGSLVGAVVGTLGLWVRLGTWSESAALVWWGRNTAGALVALGTGLLLLGARTRGRSARRRRDAGSRALELVALLAVTLALYLVVFVWYAGIPLAFPLLLPTVWAGLRFSPLTVALHSVVVSAVVLVATIRGDGPFYARGEWTQEALVSQLFVALVFGLGLLLAFGREERALLTATLSRAQEHSESQALMLSAILDSMHDGLSMVDRDGAVLMRNEAGAYMAHAEGSRDTRVSQYVMTDPDGRELTRADLPQSRVFDTDGVISQDVVLRFVDGSPARTLSISGRRLPPETAGDLERAVLVYHDVTDDREQRTSLESFAAVVAHDLRAPLAVIDGWSELLELDASGSDDLPGADVAAKVQRIRLAAGSMHGLINDLLESSTARDRTLRQEVVDLDAIARAVADQRVGVASGEAPAITVDQLPPAYADPGMVRQVLENLVSNAVKYVVPGEVARVHVSAVADGAWVELTVADHGIGIPAGQRTAVFEAFHRAPDAEGYDGHGIGLSVCRRIIERHGGTIAAKEGLDGRGTRFVLTLPAPPAAAAV